MQQNKTLKLLSGLLALIFILQSVTIAMAQVVESEVMTGASYEDSSVFINGSKKAMANAVLEPTQEFVFVDPVFINIDYNKLLSIPTLKISKASSTHFKLTWNAISGATGYRLWRSETSPSSGYSWAINVGNVTSVVTKAPSPNTTYYYKVAAITNGKVGVLSAPVGGRLNIERPSLSIFKYSVAGDQLTWNAVPGATGYRIWRSETSPSSGFTYTVDAGNVSSAYQDVPNSPTVTSVILDIPDIGKTYYYKVAAIIYSMVGPLSLTVVSEPF